MGAGALAKLLVPVIDRLAGAVETPWLDVWGPGILTLVGTLIFAGIAVWSLISARKAYREANSNAQETISEMREATESANKDAQETIKEMREANEIAIKIAETHYRERFKDRIIEELRMVHKYNHRLGNLIVKDADVGEVFLLLKKVFNKIAEALVFAANFPLTSIYYIELYGTVAGKSNDSYNPDYYQNELYKDIILFSLQDPLVLYKRKTLEEHMIYRLNDTRYPGSVDDLVSLEGEMVRLRNPKTYLLDPKDIYSPPQPEEQPTIKAEE